MFKFVRFLQAGMVAGLCVLLAVSANINKMLLPENNTTETDATTEGQFVANLRLTAGATDLFLTNWQDTKIELPEAEKTQVETDVVADSQQPESLPEVPEEVSALVTYDGPPIYDMNLFELTVQAEGYTMGYEGMRYIASAIMNLAKDRGCSVDDVLFSGAYTVVNNGMIWQQDLLPETMAAVEDELTQGQIDTEIKYFRTGYYHGFGTPCFHYGNVYFSK